MYFMAIINCNLRTTRYGMGLITLRRPETFLNADLKINLPLSNDVKAFNAYGVNTFMHLNA